MSHRSQAEAWQIAWNHRQLARFVLRGVNLPDPDRDDFLQYATLLLFQMAQRWDEGRGPFQKYAFLSLKQYFWRWQRRLRDVPLPLPVDLELPARKDVPDIEGIKLALLHLDKRTRKIVLAAVEMGLAEIGREIGLSRERVRQIRDKGMRKLRTILQGEPCTTSKRSSKPTARAA